MTSASIAGEAKSYAERLFKFPHIGSLSEEQAIEALVEPARALGVDCLQEAAKEIVDYTEGFPYFLQEYGKIPLGRSPAVTYRAGNGSGSSPAR